MTSHPFSKWYKVYVVLFNVNNGRKIAQRQIKKFVFCFCFFINIIYSILHSDYRIGVQRYYDTNRKRRQAAKFDNFLQNPGSYIAAEIVKDDVNKDSTFVIGDNKTYGSYHNPPLAEGATYKLYTGFVSRVNETVSLLRRYLSFNF